MKLQNWRGFSLIELLVVLSIIGTVSTFVTVNVVSAQKKSRDDTRKNNVTNIALAVENFYSSNKQYPVAANWTSLSGTSNILITNLVPGFIASLPTDPRSGNPPYRYITNAAGNLFSVDATLEQTDLAPLQSIDSDYSGTNDASFFKTGLYKTQDNKIHYRVSTQ